MLFELLIERTLKFEWLRTVKVVRYDITCLTYYCIAGIASLHLTNGAVLFLHYQCTHWHNLRTFLNCGFFPVTTAPKNDCRISQVEKQDQ